jgi:hypothetical protein
MVNKTTLLIGRLIAGSARADWTLLALSCLFSAAFVVVFQSFRIGG